jgi:hypothetical protein
LPGSRYWITEWNAWRDSLDEGKIGVYDYAFASEAVTHLLDLFNHNASAAFIWEGYDSYYDHHAPSIFSFWGILGYDSKSHKYAPRKHFYAISQFSKFVKPDSWRLELTGANDSLKVIAFYDGYAKKLSVIGVNAYRRPVDLGIALKNFFPFNSKVFTKQSEFFFTKHAQKHQQIRMSSPQTTQPFPNQQHPRGMLVTVQPLY